MKQVLDTITFDLWNTLIAHDEHYDDNIRRTRIEGIKDALSGKGIQVTSEDVAHAYTLSEPYLSERWSKGLDMDMDEQLGILLRCMKLDPSPELIKSIEEPYADAVLKVRPFLTEGAKEAVSWVKDNGYRVALISNTGRTPGRSMRKVMSGLGILDMFDATVFSNETGYLKPHPKIFEYALSAIGSEPHRSVHIGDHSVLDVFGARRMGMKCIQVTRYAMKDDRKHIPDIYLDSLFDLRNALSALENST